MGSPSGVNSSFLTRLPEEDKQAIKLGQQARWAAAVDANTREERQEQSGARPPVKAAHSGNSVGTQDRLDALGFSSVREFQRANGLAIDGIVGPNTRAALTAAEADASAPSSPGKASNSFVDRQRDIDRLATASPYASQAMQQELNQDVAVAESRVDDLDRDIVALGTSGGYVTQALRNEQKQIESDVSAHKALTEPEPARAPEASFAERQSDIDALSTASPYAAQAMHDELKADIVDARIRAGALNEQLQNLPTDSFSGYVRPALQAELDEINAQLAEYDRLTTRDVASLAEPGTTYLESPSNFEQVLDPLNSKGDKIEVDLSAELGVTGKVLHGGGDVGLGATIEQTDDGYVIRIDREAAIRLGLDIDAGKSRSDAEASATAGIGIESQITYRFDSKEQAAEGLRDLIITAGDDPRAGIAAAGAENAADIAHGAAGIYDGVTDGVLGFVTGGRIDNNPIGDLVVAGTGAVENGTDIARDEIDDARNRLNAARDGVQITGYFDGEITGEVASKLGLPTDIDPAELGLEGSASGRTAFTLNINGDGDIKVSATRSQEASGSVTVPNVETSTNAEISVSHQLEFKRDEDGGLVRQGAGEITFNFSADNEIQVGSGTTVETSRGGGFSYTVQVDDVAGNVALAAQQLRDGDQNAALETLTSVPGVLKLNIDVSTGAGVSGEIGTEQFNVTGGANSGFGTEATFTVNAENGLNGDVRAAATSIVNGDVAEGLEIIGNVEGDLTVQSRQEVSGNVGIEVDTKVVDVKVSGTATATDQNNALEVADVTLKDGILIAAGETGAFAADQAVG